MTFYPAVAITFFLCGRGPGLLSVFLSLNFGYFAFMKPLWTLKLELHDLPALLVFTASAVLIGAMIDQILRAAGQVSVINKQLGATMGRSSRTSPSASARSKPFGRARKSFARRSIMLLSAKPL